MVGLNSNNTLQAICDEVHIPAVSYGYVVPQKECEDFESTSQSVGKKTAKSSNEPDVNSDTRFPASSLSKIVFTYLVLQLVKEKQLDLDEPLHKILQYERFKMDNEYPDKAKNLTARHVLSHTTGLPNLGEDISSSLSFNPNSKLGETYSLKKKWKKIWRIWLKSMCLVL
ncbi:serine hydrolase [Legionella impletisoli]|uniref:Beta-lactamase-related domain-containing protein n=1 Tax=Legionella impletisoli TaxID=343510 RepID=A0A917JUS7_9GAMM|nr:serine hydrolase domain-containing protein [Legionella impletisoli]GGI87794.1 hypothetical protein GCM10007966_15670 [Legionella impletisoli]